MKNLRYIGRLSTLAFLVIGMFAFGLTFNDGQLHLKWPDILAVFIVFILADLGVELVSQAGEVQQSVDKAANRAEAVNRSAEELVDTMKELQHSLEEKVLERADKVKDEIDKSSTGLKDQSEALEGAVKSLAPTGTLHVKGLEFDEYTGVRWRETAANLESFLSCWQPEIDEESELKSEAASWMLEEIMNAFCCKNSGAVKAKNHGDIVFVAADSTFCTISEGLLKQAQKKRNIGGVERENQRTVVWAVSTLLPTEFAFPSIHWPKSSRVSTFERFVNAVKVSCNDKEPQVHEYRRLTLVTEKKESELCRYAVKPMSELKFKDYQDSLKKLVVWDWTLAAENSPFRRITDIQQERVCWKAGIEVFNQGILEGKFAGNDAEKRPGGHNIWAGLEAGCAYRFESTFPNGAGERKSKKRNKRQPRIEFLFVIDEKWGFEELIKQILAASKDEIFGEEEIPEVKNLAGWEDAEGGKIHGAAEYAGLFPVASWYTQKLHRKHQKKDDEERSVSRWLSLEERSLATLNPFKIRWDGEKGWYVMDLLLIGRRDLHSDGVDWIAALQSDLELSNPACVIRAVTAKAVLKDLSERVKELFGEAKAWPE